MSLVPSNWPLNMMSSFLARSLRRTMHAQLEKNIIKNLSAGVNYEYVMIPSSSVPSSHSLSLILFFSISRTGHGKISEMQTCLLKRRSLTTRMRRMKKPWNLSHLTRKKPLLRSLLYIFQQRSLL